MDIGVTNEKKLLEVNKRNYTEEFKRSYKESKGSYLEFKESYEESKGSYKKSKKLHVKKIYRLARSSDNSSL